MPPVSARARCFPSDQNTLTGEWREQVRCCEEQDIALDRDWPWRLPTCSNCRTIFRSN